MRFLQKSFGLYTSTELQKRHHAVLSMLRRDATDFISDGTSENRVHRRSIRKEAKLLTRFSDKPLSDTPDALFCTGCIDNFSVIFCNISVIFC